MDFESLNGKFERMIYVSPARRNVYRKLAELLEFSIDLKRHSVRQLVLAPFDE